MSIEVTNGGTDVAYYQGRAILPGQTLLFDPPDRPVASNAAAAIVAALLSDPAAFPALEVYPHLPVKTQAVDYVATVHDRVLLVDATEDDVTITLPAANASGAGFSQALRIKRIDSSENDVTVQKAGSDTIDDGTSTTLGALAALDLQSDGVSLWSVFGAYSLPAGPE